MRWYPDACLYTAIILLELTMVIVTFVTVKRMPLEGGTVVYEGGMI
jgi:uncharacterized membrane protein YhdT